MESLSELLEEQLKDLYSAENQLLKALPKMAKKTFTPELKDCFLTHAEETRVHVQRIAEACQILGIKPTGKVCAAMKGLVEEGQEVIEEEEGKNPAIDGALVAAAQRVEHYEMAAYGTVKTLAGLLGKDDLVELFETTLQEEKDTDAKLTSVVEESVYPNAAKNEGDEEPSEDDEESAPKAKGGKSPKSAAPKAKSTGKSSTGGNRTPPSRAEASKGGKNSAGKSKSR